MFPNIRKVTGNIPLDDYITSLVQDHGIKPDKQMIERLLKESKKEGKSVLKGQRTLFQF